MILVIGLFVLGFFTAWVFSVAIDRHLDHSIWFPVIVTSVLISMASFLFAILLITMYIQQWYDYLH